MTLQDQVMQYLINEEKFRERVNKDRGIVNLLLKKYPTLEAVDKKILVDLVKDYNSMDRSWRLILADKENEHLRGKDYYTKEIYSQQKQLGLGYEVGYPN